MNDEFPIIAIGLAIPFMGTALGAAMVFFLKDGMTAFMQKLLLGFASGVMIAAAVWSLLIPSMDMSKEHMLPWFPAALGFLLGMGFLLLLDTLIPHLHLDSQTPEGTQANLKKSTMLVLAVTLHNIPEGMAIGAVFAGVLAENATMSLAGALALSIGIAIQNMPEGAIISMPLVSEAGLSKRKAFAYGAASGIVEPIGAMLTILFSALLLPMMPYLLAFAAGAMMYVVVEELIPASQAEPHSNIGTVGLAAGFVLMMILDVALG
ncbi:MAG: ZIP family metal transporter [Deferribacteraceae bacterium]|jgi:ZIP family zinc transporter|nr:ZIP family metal transporter [Deferribacteraceae bacterium]